MLQINKKTVKNNRINNAGDFKTFNPTHSYQPNGIENRKRFWPILSLPFLLHTHTYTRARARARAHTHTHTNARAREYDRNKENYVLACYLSGKPR